MIIGIQDEILRLQSLGLLNRLLMDKTTKANILWATDAYKTLGQGYQRDKEIEVPLITGEHSGIITNRAGKALVQQSERTRQHAEVFTPLWICAKMNDYADEMWFGKTDVFHKNGEPTDRVIFPKRKRWQKYVDSRRMEITCGEAPFLVSRYDVSTGEAIPIERRIGILDRKLRIVGENTATEEEWLTWAIRAFQATYGYEFQGDNLLIARLNMLMTFEEYLYARWQRKPTLAEYEKITNIIAWNLWQMDGLTGTIPYCKARDGCEQVSMFELLCMEETVEGPQAQPRCRIQNWLGERSVEFSDLPIGGNHRMKFDFIIGNPPYNQEAQKTSTSDDPIYHLFMDAAFSVSDRVMLISPARFLMNAGKTPAKWNKKMLADRHFKVVYYENDTTKIFPTTSIPGGIAITYRDATQEFEPIGEFVYFPELVRIDEKVKSLSSETLDTIMYNQNKFNLANLFSDYPEMKAQIGSDGKDKRFRQIVMERFPFLFVDEHRKDAMRTLGLIKHQRAYRYILRRYVENEAWIDRYKVFVPFSNGASGTLGNQAARLISKPVLGMPGDGITQTFIGVGSFATRTEAENLLKYINSKFARALLGILKVTQGNKPETWRHVPLQDFSPASDIDWTKPIPEIDQQLYAKYGLDDDEIAFIESHVKEMD